MNKVRKIHKMYEVFGRCPGFHICKECSNFCSFRYHDKSYRKCKVYGVTNSEATDWAGRNEACGMFNKEWKNDPIIELVKRSPHIKNNAIIVNENQIMFGE